MNLSKINFNDVLEAKKQLKEGSVLTFLNEIISRKKEIEYIQNSMILSVIYISDTLKLKSGEDIKEKEMVVSRNIPKEELAEKIKELLLDFVLSADRPKYIKATEWYNFQKQYYSEIEIEHILTFFNEENKYNYYKMMTKDHPFCLSVRLSPMRENINFSIGF